jgi:hypothetical protein
MWDVQDRDGHCELGTGQKPKPWKNDDNASKCQQRNLQILADHSFADCTLCINLWNAVVLQSGDARRMSLLEPRTLACRTRPKLSSAKERRPFLFLRNKLPIATDSLVHCAKVGFWMWILTNEGSLSEMLSLIFDKARRTAHRTYSCGIAILGPYLTTATLHCSQRFGVPGGKKIPESTKSSKLHHFILGSLLNTTFVINKIN